MQATGPDTGLIETITSSRDIGWLKSGPGYTSLRDLFTSRYGEPGSDGFIAAQSNFRRSLAAYSIVMWLLLLRDRHNGNLMIDDAGHFFHIDFGFVLGHSTGKGIGGMVECSPWKLTSEYSSVLDGPGQPATHGHVHRAAHAHGIRVGPLTAVMRGAGSETYAKYCEGCVAAMRAARRCGETICTMVEIAGTRGNFPCFLHTPVEHVSRRRRTSAYRPSRRIITSSPSPHPSTPLPPAAGAAEAQRASADAQERRGGRSGGDNDRVECTLISCQTYTIPLAGCTPHR